MHQMPPPGTTLAGQNGPPTQDTIQTTQSDSSPQPSTMIDSKTSGRGTSTSEHSFTDPNNMPPPGVELFEARRARWLSRTESHSRQQSESSPSTSRAKLEALLASDDEISSEEVWNAGIGNVWKGLVGGGRLRRRLPLGIVLKILRAGWLRDGTWPSDAAGKPLRVSRAAHPTSHLSPSDSPRGRQGDEPEADLPE